MSGTGLVAGGHSPPTRRAALPTHNAEAVAPLRERPGGSRAPGGVLVLDGQTNQALACVRSLGRAGHRVLVASRLRWPLGAWSRFCAARFHLEDEGLRAFAALRAWACSQGVDTVLPLTERACLLCNADRAAWESAGIAVGCEPDEVLQRAFDKLRTLAFAVSCGVRTPRTFHLASLRDAHRAAAALGYPLVVKPRLSHAWNGSSFLPDLGPCYVARAAELEEAVLSRRQGDRWPMLQEFVGGRGKGVFALCDRGRGVAWFAHERLRDVRPSGSGSSLRRAAALEPRLRQPAERLLGAMRWHGPAMVEFRDDGSAPPCLIEVNGRFWGSLQLAIEGGADFPRLWLEILHGHAVEPLAEYRTDLTLRWLWGDVKRLLFILRGPPPGYPGRYPTLREGVRELLGPQPPGTHSETWDPADRWPALGEWVQGIAELLTRRRERKDA